MPVSFDRVSMFFSGHPTLLLVLVYFLFMSEFCQELLVHSCRPSATFAWLPVHGDEPCTWVPELEVDDS